MADINEDTAPEVTYLIPAIRLKSDAEVEVSERVTLFYIDDVAYTVPKKPSPRTSLRYLFLLQTEGEGNANYYLLNALLGTKGYKALMDYEPLTTEQYNQILGLAVEISTGRTERPKANQRRTTRSGNAASGRSSGRRSI